MTTESYKPKSADETSVLEIYHRLLDAWNDKDPHRFAHLFSGTAYAIGFDGSQMIGQAQIESELKNIFDQHATGRYVAKVRDIRHLDIHCLLLYSVAGIISPGNTNVDPKLNSVQSLIAVKNNGIWHIELFQNTPAQFHGKPELTNNLTTELNELV